MPQSAERIGRRGVARKRKTPVARARAQMYRELVLHCAERVFARRGYHAARMQEVASEAGISLNTLYAAFPGKREVFDALHESRGAEFLDAVSGAMPETLAPVEALRAGVRAFVAYLVQHPDYFRVDLREGRSWAIGDVEASPAFQAGIENWTRLMRRGIASGAFVDEDPEIMAVTTFGVMQIQLATWLAREDEPDAAHIAGRICAHLERTLCTPDVAHATPGEEESA